MAGLERGWMKALAVAVLLVSMAAVGFAQSPEMRVVEDGSTGALSGKLTDLHSKPLEGVTVVLRNQATGAEWRSTTAKNGAFRFTGLEPGVYTLKAESPELGRGQVEEIVHQFPHCRNARGAASSSCSRCSCSDERGFDSCARQHK